MKRKRPRHRRRPRIERLLDIIARMAGGDLDINGTTFLDPQAMDSVRAQVISRHPEAEIGFTGGAVTTLGEHRAISTGMLLSCLVTGVLVAVLLGFYFRSASMLAIRSISPQRTNRVRRKRWQPASKRSPNCRTYFTRRTVGQFCSSFRQWMPQAKTARSSTSCRA